MAGECLEHHPEPELGHIHPNSNENHAVEPKGKLGVQKGSINAYKFYNAKDMILVPEKK